MYGIREKTLAISVLFLLNGILPSCNNKKYIVTWLNYDGTVLETDTGVTYGTMPTYDGETPTKPSTAQYTYTFSGWDKTIEPVIGDVTYTAQFNQETNKYTVTWLNYDGTVLETDTGVTYGTMPTYDGETPTKPSTAQYTYTFSGWDKTIEPVIGDVTYTAQFNQETNTYKISFINDDAEILQEEMAPYGTLPIYKGGGA